MRSFRAICGDDDRLVALLRSHPGVSEVVEGGAQPLEFSSNGLPRRVLVGDREAGPRGLVELMDNNPIVCADAMSVPSPASTLALICLGPLARAGLLAEPPLLHFSFPADPEDVSNYLATESWNHGALVESGDARVEGVLACSARAVVRTPERLEDVDELYEECFGRAFYVRREEEAEWSVQLVAGRPHAVYRLRMVPEAGASLIAVDAMADASGKCGAAQIVHAFNLMAGFEESLGIGG